MAGARYLSSVPGHAVARFGHPDLLVGVERDATAEGGLRWELDRIVEIPEAEFQAFAREYLGALRDGSLVECTPEQFSRQARAEAVTRSELKAQE
jgi:hypothetical protein